MDGGGNNAIRRDKMHQPADSHHIRHGVHSADLVKMNLLHAASVDMALGLRNQLKNGQCILPDRLGQGKMSENMLYLMQAGVRMGMFMQVMGMLMLIVLVLMVILVKLFVFLTAIHGDGDMGAGDAAAFCR